MSRRYNAADYHPGLNPSLPKTNSPWRFWGIVLLLAAILGFGWRWLSPDIRLTRPELSFTTGKVTATALATNRTMQTVTLKVRLAIGWASPGTKYRARNVREFANKEVVVRIPADTETPISCEFPMTDRVPNYSEARVVSMQGADSP